MINPDWHPRPRTPGSVVLSHYFAVSCPDKSPLKLIRNAMTFPFIHDGIPIVYYGMSPLPSVTAVPECLFLGQEQGYQGGTDPYNREA
jgi:hypothetical protein